MNWPTSQDYNEAIQNPKTSFSDAGLKNGEVVVNAIGLPVPRSGNFADVYQYKGGEGKTWALKCFTRRVTGLQERYAKIDEHIAKANFPFTVGFKFLAQGVRIRGEWFPLLKMEWVEGFTLNEFVRDNAGKPSYLQALLQMWAKLTARLRDGNFAHADLQHGNVLLVPGDAQNKLGLRLIDYDGMWVPALAEHHSGEIGHPNFQHPFRLRDRLYNLDVDRFPHLVIACALRATMLGGRALWDRFDNGDNLLFKEADLRDPGAAPVFKSLWEMNDDVLCTLVGKLALASREPLRKTPWLDDVLQEEGGPRLTEDEEKKVMSLLGVGPHFTAGKAAPMPLPVEAAAANEFSDFRVEQAEGPPRPSGRYEAVKKKRPPARYEDEEAEPPRQKSKLPLYIGGGVLAVGLLVGVLALALSGGSKPTNASVAKNHDKEKEDVPRDVVAPPLRRDTTSEAPKKGPPPEIKNDPPAEVKKGPPPEVKNDPPAEVKKGPPAEVKRGPTDRPPPLQVNTPTAVVGVVAVPPSRDALFICKDSRSLVRAFSVLGPKPTAIGKHNGAVRAAACTSDGTVAVSGGDDNTVRVWSLDDPKQLHALTEHTRPVVACAISPDDDRAISLGADSLLCEWDIREGKLLGRIEMPGARAIAYLRSGKAVLVGTAAESAAIFDLERKVRIRNLPGHKGSVNAVCVSSDGKTGFTAGDDFIIRCWNLETGAELRTLNRHTAPVFALCLTPDERFLVSGGADNLVCTWDYRAGSLHSSFANPERLRVVSIVAPGDELLVGMGDDIGPGKLLFRHFNITGPPPAKRPEARPGDLAELWSNNGAFGPLAFSPDGGKVIAAGFAGAYRTFALRDGADLENLNISSPQSFTGYAMLADGSLLVRNAGKTKGAAGEGYCWDPQTKARRFTIEDDSANFRFVAVAPKANIAAIGQKGGGVAIYSLTDGKKMESYAMPAAGPLHSVTITDDGEAILVHVGTNRICFRPRKGAPFGELAQLDYRGGFIPLVRLSPNGQVYAQYGGDKSDIQLYEAASGSKLRTLVGHTAKAVDVRFTQDGRRLVSIGDSTIRIWDVAAGTEIKQGALAGINPLQLAVSADGKYAVTTVGPSLKMQFWQLPSENAPPVVKEAPPPPPKKEPATEIVMAPQLKEACKIEHKLVGKGVTFSGDGNRLLACPAGGLDISVFNTADGARLQALRMPKSSGTLAVADDGNLVVGSRDGLGVFLFDAASKMRTTNFDVVNNYEMRMALIAKDKSVLLPDGRGALGVYALADGKLTASYPIKDQIIGVSCTPDGQDIVALTAPGDIFMKTAADKTFRLLGNYVKALNVEIAPDGKKFLVAYDVAPKVYGVDGKEQVVFEGKAGWVRYAAFLKDGRHVVTIHGNALLRLWDAETGKQIQQITLPPDSGGYVAVSGDGRFVAAGSGPNAIQIWRIESTAVLVASPIVPKKTDAEAAKDGPSAVSGELLERVASCFYSSDGKKIYAAVNNGVVHVLDPLTLQETQKFNAVDARVVSATAAPKSLAAGAKDFIYILDDQKRLSIFDPEKGAVTRTLSFEAQLSDPNKPPSYNLLVTPDTQIIMVLSRSAWRGVSWNLKLNTELTLNPLQRFAFRNSTHTVAFTPDGKVGAAATTSKLLIWSGKTGLDIATIDCKFTQHLAIVPDANLVASQGSSQFVGFNVLTGKEIWNEKLPPFSEGLQAIPKSKRLAFATPTEIVIRECVKGEDTHRWKCAGNGATLLTASSDGKYLVSFSNSERKVSLWAIPAVTTAKKP